MRIISGKYRSKRITAPANLPARPTTDMAKESLFNLLYNYVDFDDITVLDLFGGTGNVSYEFASRGCRFITIVEQDYRCFKFIKKTVSQLHFDNEISVVKGDAFKYVQRTSRQFDVVFADPPYDIEGLREFILTIMERNVVKPGGLFVIEHSSREKFDDLPGFVDQRKYGSVNFSIFKQE